MTRQPGRAALAALLLAASTNSGAEGPWYFGVTLGPGNAEVDEALAAPAGGGSGSLSRDERDPAYKVLLGYRFGEHFAVEGGYAQLGEYRITRGQSATDALNADVRVKGLLLQGVGRLPLGAGIGLVARGGVLLSETKTFRAVSGGAAFAGAAAGSTIADEFNRAWGLGLEYRWSNTLTLRIDWDRYLKVGDPASTGEADLDVYGVGLNLRF